MRALLLLPGGFALLAGLDAALTLAGLPAPTGAARLADLHGTLMVVGFLGTVIALERAVAARATWAYAAPALLGAGAVAIVALPEATLGRLLAAQGAATLVAVYVALWRRNRDPAVATEALGAVALTAATVLLRVPMPAVVPLLLAFIVATIAAERVELARLAMPADAGSRLVTAGVALVAAAAAAVLWPPVGGRMLGLVLLTLTAWLVRHDVARRTIRSVGLPRFAAAAMLAGYGWLALAGAWLLGAGLPQEGPGYDIVVHATFLGFAMSMVMAHAPVILPAVLRVHLPYRRRLYAPLAVLHAGLAVRLLLGHRVGAHTAWQIGAAAGVAALLLFVLVSALTAVGATTTARRGRRVTRDAAGTPTPTGPTGHTRKP